MALKRQNFHMADHETQTRVILRVIWELLKEQRFANVGDFADVLKFRLAKLKVKWNAEHLTRAFARISSHTSIVPKSKPTVVEREQSPQPTIQPEEWQRMYEAVMARYAAEHPVTEIQAPMGQPEDFPSLVVVRPWK